MLLVTTPARLMPAHPAGMSACSTPNGRWDRGWPPAPFRGKSRRLHRLNIKKEIKMGVEMLSVWLLGVLSGAIVIVFFMWKGV